MANTQWFETKCELPLVDLIDGTAALSIDAEILVSAEEEPIMVGGKAMKVFTVQTGPHTSKKFVIDLFVFHKAFSPVNQNRPMNGVGY